MAYTKKTWGSYSYDEKKSVAENVAAAADAKALITTDDLNHIENGIAAIGDNRLIPTGGTNGQVVKADANGKPVWGSDTDTSYQAMTSAEAQAGTVTTARTITPKVLADEIDRRVAAAIAASNTTP